MNKIYFFLEERNDAIGKYSQELIKEWKKIQTVRIVGLSWPSKLKIFILFFDSIKVFLFILLAKIQGATIVFTDPKLFPPYINCIIKYNKSILFINHFDEVAPEFHNNIFNYENIFNSFGVLISISKQTQKDVVSKYPQLESKTEFINLGLDSTIFKPPAKYILYIGSEIPRKNTETLFKAFAQLAKVNSDIMLIKGGYSGGDDWRQKSLNQIKKLGIEKRVIFLGTLSEQELALYYQHADVFAFPSLHEGFGMPLIEAMACGCPIITTNKPPMSDICKSQYLIEPSVSALYKGLTEILSDSSLRDDLSKRAIEASSDFSWKISTETLSSLSNKI